MGITLGIIWAVSIILLVRALYHWKGLPGHQTKGWHRPDEDD